MTTHLEDTPRITGWMILRPLLGLGAAVCSILLCVLAITRVSGPLVVGPYEWLGHTIVAAAFMGILVSGFLGVRCKVSFVVNLRGWLIQACS